MVGARGEEARLAERKLAVHAAALGVDDSGGIENRATVARRQGPSAAQAEGKEGPAPSS